MKFWANLESAARRNVHAAKLACVLALAAFTPNMLSAATPHRLVLPSPCILVQSIGDARVEQFAANSRFDCREASSYNAGVVTYGLFNKLNILNNNPNDPLQLRLSAYQLADEVVIVRFADGKILTSPTNMMAARRRYSAGLFVFTLPLHDKPITSILMRVDKFAGERGIAENAMIMSQSLGAKDDIKFMFVFALLGGALGALFIYNVSLYAVLRYRFVLAHCATSLAVMIFMVSWSGAIFYAFPDMTPNGQIVIIFISAAPYVCALVVFMLTFIERQLLSRARFLPVFFAALCLCAASVGPLMYGYVTNDFLNLFYFGVMGSLLSMLACAVRARRNGSQSAGYYLFVWSLPISFAIVRVLWAFGLFHMNSVIAESSPSFIMVLESLTSALAVTWRIGQLCNERDAARAMQRELTHLAATDPLTGLLNRRAFLEQSRDGEMLKQFILIDIDDFKRINDTFGHEMGDRTIVAVAESIAQLVPETCLVGRMGGEEFGVIICDLAPFLAQRICEAIRGVEVVSGVRVTASAGVAIGPINSAEDWHQIYTAADRALYEAKRSGRDRVCQSPALAA
jgi:diguanylate cyclase (GGDEF)-like protein